MRGYRLGRDMADVMQKLDTLITQQGVMMAKIDELTAEVDSLTTAVTGIAADIDTEQAEIQKVIDDLKALLASGATAAQLQTEIDKLQAAKSALSTARADLASTVEAVPEPPPAPPVEPPTGGGEAGVSGGQQSFRRR